MHSYNLHKIIKKTFDLNFLNFASLYIMESLDLYFDESELEGYKAGVSENIFPDPEVVKNQHLNFAEIKIENIRTNNEDVELEKMKMEIVEPSIQESKEKEDDSHPQAVPVKQQPTVETFTEHPFKTLFRIQQKRFKTQEIKIRVRFRTEF
jgi:hypothetical protein